MPDVVIEIRGGNVVAAYCNDPRVRVRILDWDKADSHDSPAFPAALFACDSVAAMPIDTMIALTPYESA